jgi:heme-degrading monooxygenase HmoA
MYVAMNRFKIVKGHEEAFIAVWKNRKTYLNEAPGFREFHLLKGPVFDDHTLFASHSIWESQQAFENWTRSEAFHKAHGQAGAAKGIYLGPPQFEGFSAVL